MTELSTPVALFIFNRPGTTRQVFDAIAAARPRRLLIVADGPRAGRSTDAANCAAARAIVERIDWPCEVVKNYSDENLGCAVRVSSGLDWVFEQTEEAIILEDDCLPSASFFPFCEQLLAHYRHDARIMHISGDNFQRGVRRSPASYYFSRIPHVWGWATWRRAWRCYDFHMASWPEFEARHMIKGIFPDAVHQATWVRWLSGLYRSQWGAWDAQWVYACWSRGALSIMPEVNLVSNIGVGCDATHTKTDAWFMNLPRGQIDTITHPRYVLPDVEADHFTLREHFGCHDEKSMEKLSADRRRLTARVSRIGGRFRRLLRGESKSFPLWGKRRNQHSPRVRAEN
jgi:hypothetical protein